jgi:hypothetical protein
MDTHNIAITTSTVSAFERRRYVMGKYRQSFQASAGWAEPKHRHEHVVHCDGGDPKMLLTCCFLSYFWVAAASAEGLSAEQEISRMLAHASSTARRCAILGATVPDDHR